MSAKNTVQAIPLTSIGSAALTANYQPINPNGLPEACFLIRIATTSSTTVTLSYDGVTDHEIVIFGDDAIVLPFQTNSRPNSNVALIAAGTVVYAKGTAGTGRIYLSGYYQPNQ